MAHFALLVLLRLVGEDRDLLALAVLNCLGCHIGTLNIGSADLDAVVCTYSNNLIKNYFAVSFNVKLFDEDD